MARIRVSYTDPKELQEIVRRLQPVRTVNISKNTQGGFKKAYIELADGKGLHTYVRGDIIELE